MRAQIYFFVFDAQLGADVVPVKFDGSRRQVD